MTHNVYGHITDRRLGEFFIEIQRVQFEKERVRLSAMGSVFMFFSFLLVGSILLTLQLLSITEFLVLLIATLIILIIATYPYVKSLKREEELLDQMSEKLRK